MSSEQIAFDFQKETDDRTVTVQPPPKDANIETFYYLSAFKGRKGTVERALNDGHGSVVVRFSKNETGIFHEDELKGVD